MSQFFTSTGPKYWTFSFSISPSSEYSGLIAFSMGWLDLLAVQGTLKSLPQRHSSKASILRCSAFFMFKILSLSSKTVLLYLLPHAWSFGSQELLEVFLKCHLLKEASWDLFNTVTSHHTHSHLPGLLPITVFLPFTKWHLLTPCLIYSVIY